MTKKRSCIHQPFGEASFDVGHYGAEWRVSAVGVVLEWERFRMDRWEIRHSTTLRNGTVYFARNPETGFQIEVRWEKHSGGWVQKKVKVTGKRDSSWGRFGRMIVFDEPMPGRTWDDQMGWREWHGDVAVEERRSLEEGIGTLPPCGYPVFGERFFAGIEHPMGINQVIRRHLVMLHHPQWKGDQLESHSMVIGFVRPKETLQAVFQRYLQSIRIPPPARAIVEVCTFWTDPHEERNGQMEYRIHAKGYLRLAEEWVGRVLGGRKGLVTQLLLDAGWYLPHSLFRPKRSLAGKKDSGLAELGRRLNRWGVDLGLWWTWNGPMGVNADYARRRGFRVSAKGSGGAYGDNGGETHYMCLTDPKWEAAIGQRIEEVIDHTPVAFFKVDWDNEGIEDPTLVPSKFYLREQTWEANTEVMIRLYRRALARRPGVGIRGGWWLSPWWMRHVSVTHLPNSGDSESADVPGLTQRDGIITSRDTVIYHHMVTCRTPVPWDALNHHEFSAAPRNTVNDTDESWLHNLMMWVLRGSHYLQIYMPPYGVHGWRAWSLREMLAWFRQHEDLLWKSPMRMLGGDPGDGKVYGYLHDDSRRQLMVFRNPMGFPQRALTAHACGLSAHGWVRLFPSWENSAWENEWMPSNAVWVLARGNPKWISPKGAWMHGPSGRLVPWMAADARQRHGTHGDIPPIHRVDFRAIQLDQLEHPHPKRLFLHAQVPYGYQKAEWILKFRLSHGRPSRIRASCGRYPDGLSSAPIPVTWLQPHWKLGCGQKRMGRKPFDAHLAVARIPCNVGGEVHLFLESDRAIPALDSVWIEAEEISICSEKRGRRMDWIPPSLPVRKSVLGEALGGGTK